MEIKRKELRLFAKLGFLLYVDGYTAKIAGMKPGKDQQGGDVWDFTLDPSDELIKRYDLKVNSDGDMLYTCQLPYELVIQLNADPAWNRWFYIRTYDGKTTPEIEKLEGSKKLAELMKLKHTLREMEMKLEVAEEKLMLMETNMPKHLERNFKPMIEQMLPILEKVVKKSD